MKKLLFLLCTLGVMAACSSDDDESGSGFVPQPSERTVIVYMAGENNLTAYVNTNLREMKEGSRQLSPSSCLLVYVDKSKNSELPWLARIRDGQVTDSVSLHDMGISDKDEYTSDPYVMERVLKYAVSRYPASDYGLVLWGHSTGWVVTSDSIAYTRAYGVDNGLNSAVSAEGMWLNVPTLGRVLAKLPHWKFIFADCCNFMCLETLYELRSVTDYVIGSPVEIPQEGAPYQTLTPAMFDRSNFATLMVDRYYEQKIGGLDLPLTAVKMSEMEQLARATRTAVQAVKTRQTTEYADLKDLIYYYYRSSRFFYDQANNIFYDAGDFLRAKAPEADYQQWKSALDKAIVKKTFSAKWKTDKKWDTFYGNNFTVTPERQHGVSMYIPQSPFAGSHADYSRDIKKFAWWYAVWQ